MQEAISNVRKHSQAQKARVTLDNRIKAYSNFQSAMNGVGFDTTATRGKGQPNFGLATMRERAESIGASFDVKSTLGSGTIISVTLSSAEKLQ